MRTKIIAAAAIVLFAAGLAATKAKFTPVSGTAWMIAPSSGAEVKCHGGTPTGTWPPCSPGSAGEIRGMNLTYYQQFRKADGSLDPLHTGLRTLVFNANFDENGGGHGWGTWHVVLDGGIGEWEGTYNGFATVWFGPADGEIVGRGTQGVVEGMLVKFAFSYETFPRDPATGLPGLETITGYRLEPRDGGPASLTVASAVPNPVVSGPIPATATPGDPSHHYPFFSTTVDLASEGYIEEEFFFEGTANRYNIPSPFATATVIDTGHPYRTRMIVRRPASPDKFNGVVLMEWLNVTVGYDLDGNWLQSYEHLMRRGYAWVGVSAQRVGIHQPGTGLKVWSPSRYGTLDVTQGGTITNDALQYDIFSQAAQAVRSPSGVDPMGALHVEQILAFGASQSATRLVTYHNSIHPLAGVIDGFLLIVGGPQLRTDLDVKVFKFLSETDVIGTQITLPQAPIRQPDSDHYRTWEVAGAAHIDFHVIQELLPLQARDGIAPLFMGCDLPPFSRIPFYFVGNAMLDHMVDWVKYNIQPPSAPLIEIQTMGPPVVAARDSFGNVLGGIRLSQHAVPTATNTGVNTPVATACRTFGTFQPFDAGTLATLYPEHGTYVSQVTQTTHRNLRNGFIVVEDAIATVRDAAQSGIGRD